ncbi:hypothetical protein [Actinocorallia lasiicapitis]
MTKTPNSPITAQEDVMSCSCSASNPCEDCMTPEQFEAYRQEQLYEIRANMHLPEGGQRGL